jgi:hypothetical protein
VLREQPDSDESGGAKFLQPPFQEVAIAYVATPGSLVVHLIVVTMPAETELSRRGKVIVAAMQRWRLRFDRLTRTARVRPVRLRALMMGGDPHERELVRLAITLRLPISELTHA